MNEMKIHAYAHAALQHALMWIKEEWNDFPEFRLCAYGLRLPPTLNDSRIRFAFATKKTEFPSRRKNPGKFHRESL